MASVVTKCLGSLQNSYANTRTNGINGYERLVGGEVFWAPQVLSCLQHSGISSAIPSTVIVSLPVPHLAATLGSHVHWHATRTNGINGYNVMVLLVERLSGLPSEQPPLWDLTSTQLVPTASMGMNILFAERPSELPSEQVLRLTKATASGSSLPKTLPISVNSLTSSIRPTTSAIYSSAPSAPGLCHVTMYPIHQSMRSEVPTRYIRNRIECFAPSMYRVLRLTKATASGSSLPKTLPISINGLTSPICPNTSAIYSSALSAPGLRRVTMYPIHQSIVTARRAVSTTCATWAWARANTCEGNEHVVLSVTLPVVTSTRE
ncbi:hypothetical protein BJV78DRAFT_1287890 [Lactifluus subvellereus]|nr:hypothetical protein BJV78DRAFT_1287890 [Lactifluus subvellereus]